MEVSDSKMREDRLNQTRQSVKKFFYAIFDACHSETQAPNRELLQFIDKLSSPGSLPAENFLHEYEKKRLRLHENGTLDEATGHNEKRMITVLFVLVKLLIGQGLMNLSKTGLKYDIADTFKRQAILNCRIVASVIVYVCLDYIDSFMQGYS
jgi:hypothetical protein